MCSDCDSASNASKSLIFQVGDRVQEINRRTTRIGEIIAFSGDGTVARVKVADNYYVKEKETIKTAGLRSFYKEYHIPLENLKLYSLFE